jgi:hypothetical protein
MIAAVANIQRQAGEHQGQSWRGLRPPARLQRRRLAVGIVAFHNYPVLLGTAALTIVLACGTRSTPIIAAIDA